MDRERNIVPAKQFTKSDNSNIDFSRSDHVSWRSSRNAATSLLCRCRKYQLMRNQLGHLPKIMSIGSYRYRISGQLQ